MSHILQALIIYMRQVSCHCIRQREREREREIIALQVVEDKSCPEKLLDWTISPTLLCFFHSLQVIHIVWLAICICYIVSTSELTLV